MSVMPRSARSSTSPVRSTRSAEQARPQLHVSGTSSARSAQDAKVRKGMMSVFHPSRANIVHVAGAVVFLIATLIGSLVLRTQMVEDSFAITDTQQSIARLTQDIQEDQSKLDALDASLPDKAQKLGMVPGADALTIDLQGYANKGTQAKEGK